MPATSLDVVLAGGLDFTVGGGESGVAVVRSLLDRVRVAPVKLDSEVGSQTKTIVQE